MLQAGDARICWVSLDNWRLGLGLTFRVMIRIGSRV